MKFKLVEDWDIKYDPPYNAEQIKTNYGEDLYNKLIQDPAHKWRMETGIELIHKEPTKKELDRIWNNWQLMTPEQKSLSDEKSFELFGVSNKENYNNLISLYEDWDRLKEDSFKDYSADHRFIYQARFTKTIDDKEFELVTDDFNKFARMLEHCFADDIEVPVLVHILHLQFKDDELQFPNIRFRRDSLAVHYDEHLLISSIEELFQKVKPQYRKTAEQNKCPNDDTRLLYYWMHTHNTNGIMQVVNSDFISIKLDPEKKKAKIV